MTERQRPIRRGRSPENLALVFRDFGEFEAPQLGGHLYEALCPRIAADAGLLEVASAAAPSQPPPNLLFGAVHYLLLDGRVDPLRHFYADLGGRAEAAAAFPRFRAFVMEHREAIEGLVRSRPVQTSVIQRCTVLLPAFAHVARRAPETSLALVEIGPSAGLNLLWDRYGYVYSGLVGDGGRRWGDPVSAVQLSAQVRGPGGLPTLPRSIGVAWRVGVELAPVDIADEDAVRWLRALIWPEHAERYERLSAAIAIARRERPRVIQGDATEQLGSVLAEAPPDAALCVYATHTLYQISSDGRRRIYEALGAASARRVVWFVSIEGTGIDYSELFVHRYEGGERTFERLANCSPHGRWIEWLGDGDDGGASAPS